MAPTFVPGARVSSHGRSVSLVEARHRLCPAPFNPGRAVSGGRDRLTRPPQSATMFARLVTTWHTHRGALHAPGTRRATTPQPRGVGDN